MKSEIVRRYRGNPILTKAAIPYAVLCVDCQKGEERRNR